VKPRVASVDPKAAYHRPASDYYGALAGWRAVSYERRRARILPLLGGRVLDVGCADGRIALALLGDRGTGIDTSAAMLADARSRAPEARLARADGEALPFRDGAFDTALVSHAIWLFPSPTRFFAEARRVLRAGGRLVVVSNQPHYFVARSVVLATVARGHAEPAPMLHRRAEIEAALLASGFTSIRTEPFLVLPVPGFAWLDRTPLKRLGLSFVTTATRPA